MDFTQEVLQIIFSFLDGASLMKCRRVCSLWLSEVHHVEQMPNFWKKRCVEEVSWDFLPSYIEKINPIYFSDNKIKFSWKDVYICWYRWKSLGKWPSNCRELDIKRPGKIVRAEFYGDWIVYATYEYSALIACHIASPLCTAKILYQGARLKNFRFMSSDNPSRPPLSAVFINTERDYCFLDVQERRVIGGVTAVPCLSDNEWCRETVLAKREQLRAVNPDIVDLELSRNIYDFICHDRPFKETCFKWIILHHKVALGFSDMPDYTHVIAFVVGEKYKFYLTSVNFGKISTALLHGNNFFVGTSNAMLHRYTIKNIGNFLDFDFDQFDWSLKVHNSNVYDEIISLDVCELNKRPLIAVAIGTCRIVLVNFMGDDEEEVEQQYFPNVLTALD
ncbi:hypothetical protein LSTR_LSTR016562 [Laodelphax striatellus]|uniref:F-box domain-containing protein n=1 Tax=Laodelphax striatellus TaxID=195883 RepID=A0A482XL32_LAOST|nr:hypothetical protein LSTR_LSTR012058 [Laodelphax striatellus]RZF46397.1 hypothetical protein LSTR_LSTR016562 [Laodelphax striatellus]